MAKLNSKTTILKYSNEINKIFELMKHTVNSKELHECFKEIMSCKYELFKLNGIWRDNRPDLMNPMNPHIEKLFTEDCFNYDFTLDFNNDLEKIDYIQKYITFICCNKQRFDIVGFTNDLRVFTQCYQYMSNIKAISDKINPLQFAAFSSRFNNEGYKESLFRVLDSLKGDSEYNSGNILTRSPQNSLLGLRQMYLKHVYENNISGYTVFLSDLDVVTARNYFLNDEIRHSFFIKTSSYNSNTPRELTPIDYNNGFRENPLDFKVSSQKYQEIIDYELEHIDDNPFLLSGFILDVFNFDKKLQTKDNFQKIMNLNPIRFEAYQINGLYVANYLNDFKCSKFDNFDMNIVMIKNFCKKYLIDEDIYKKIIKSHYEKLTNNEKIHLLSMIWRTQVLKPLFCLTKTLSTRKTLTSSLAEIKSIPKTEINKQLIKNSFNFLSTTQVEYNNLSYLLELMKDDSKNYPQRNIIQEEKIEKLISYLNKNITKLPQSQYCDIPILIKIMNSISEMYNFANKDLSVSIKDEIAQNSGDLAQYIKSKITDDFVVDNAFIKELKELSKLENHYYDGNIIEELVDSFRIFEITENIEIREITLKHLNSRWNLNCNLNNFNIVSNHLESKTIESHSTSSEIVLD